MGFLGKLSGAGSVWFNLDEVFDQFVEDGGDIVESIEALEEPSSEGALDAGEQLCSASSVFRRICDALGSKGYPI